MLVSILLGWYSKGKRNNLKVNLYFLPYATIPRKQYMNKIYFIFIMCKYAYYKMVSRQSDKHFTALLNNAQLKLERAGEEPKFYFYRLHLESLT